MAKVRVTLTLEIDEGQWCDYYEITRDEFRDDVRGKVQQGAYERLDTILGVIVTDIKRSD